MIKDKSNYPKSNTIGLRRAQIGEKCRVVYSDMYDMRFVFSKGQYKDKKCTH